MRIASIPTILAVLAARGLPGLAQDQIKVGEFASLTGGSASFGQSSHNGTALAVDEINAAGGVLGKKIDLITEDDRSEAGEPATIVRKLISQDNVIAVLGRGRFLEVARSGADLPGKPYPDDLAGLDQPKGHARWAITYSASASSIPSRGR